VICHKALQGTLEDSTHLVVEHLDYELQLLLIVIGYAANERQGEVVATIARDVIVDEIAEGAVNQLSDALFVEMAMDEL
jgi:hypothetical protein